MTTSSLFSRACGGIAIAAQCAASLSAVFAVICLVAWMAGLGSLGQISALLAGVFGGSFVAALVRSGAAAQRGARGRPRIK